MFTGVNCKQETENELLTWSYFRLTRNQTRKQQIKGRERHIVSSSGLHLIKGIVCHFEKFTHFLSGQELCQIYASALSLLRAYAIATASGQRHCEHFCLCIGVTLQLHHQTACWRRCLYAIVLSFFATVFHVFVGPLRNNAAWKWTDHDGVRAERLWTAVTFPDISTMQERKMTSDEIVCMMAVKKENPEMWCYQADQSHFLQSALLKTRSYIFLEMHVRLRHRLQSRVNG